MLTLIAVVALLAGAGAWEVILLSRRARSRKMTALVAALWLVATLYAAVVVSEIELINPNKIIIALLDLIYSRFP
ncbi:MAG TPA: hypothetical protein PLY40_04530 [Bacillota bacterium]|nr:hypothetical protein [Bacillota bacterium]